MSSSPPSSRAPPVKIWHRANCHCGTVRYRVFLSPLVGVPNPHLVRNCNYNLCTRNGYLNVYPLRHEVQVPINHNLGDGSQVEGMPGSETLRRAKKEVLGYYPYSDFMNEENEHVFCKKCGSSLWVDTRGGEEKAKEMRKEEVKDIVAVNVRMFQDIEVKDLNLEFFDGRSLDPQYKI